MTEIKRYFVYPGKDNGVTYNEDSQGWWCKWSDIEALIKERDEMRNRALAAVWLLPEHIGIPELLDLREEAREVFMGKDKQIIAKLHDELRYAQEYARQIQRQPRPGVNSVCGFKPNDKGEMRYALMITKVDHAPNGGLEIEVQLP
jgi:hypothetical protein